MESSQARASVSELNAYMSIILRRKWVIFISVIVVTAVAVGATVLFSTPMYTSSTEIYLRRSGLDRALLGTDIFQQSIYQPERNMQTAAELVLAPEVVSSVNETMSGKLSGRNAASFIDVSLVKQTDMLSIAATTDDPELAADVANTFAAEYINWRQDVDKQILQDARAPIEAQVAAIPADQQSSVSYQVLTEKLETLKLVETIQFSNLEVVKPAFPASSPSSPKPLRTGIIAFFVSLVFSTGAILLSERFDTRIRSTNEISNMINKPILASIPRMPSSNGSLATLESPSSAQAEAFRLLKTNLSYVEPDRELKSILITSTEPSEGKSTTVANLAVTMARAGQRVIIIEGDLRRPKLSKYLQLNDTVGITNIISGTASLRESLQMIEARDLAISPQSSKGNVNEASDVSGASFDGIKPIYAATSGPLPPNPGELAASSKLASIIDEACEYADIVLIDAPPMGAVGDAASMASRVDGVVLVIMMSETSKKSLVSMNHFIDSVPSNVLGLVVTNAGSEGTYYYNYEYSQGNTKEA